MTTQAEYAARVPDRETRLKAVQLYDGTAIAEEARDRAMNSAELKAKYEPLLAQARAEFDRREAELKAQMAAEAGAPELQAAYEAALKAWHDFDCPRLITDFEGEAERCALSGLPIFEDDPIVEDTETGEKVLKVCLGVPLDPDDESFLMPPEEAKAAA